MRTDNLKMPEISFDFLKYMTDAKGAVEDNIDSYLSSKNITLSDEDRKILKMDTTMMELDVLSVGGILRDTRMKTYSTYESYLNWVKVNLKANRQKEHEKWIDNRVARNIFCKSKPKDEKLADKIEDSLNVIEEYYEGFTEKGVRKAMIEIRERNYGGSKRIGIAIKAEPYASQFTLVVMGINGDYNIANEGGGWDLELENGAKCYNLSKTYSSLPNKEDLIDDFCVLKLLTTFPPKDKIMRDTGELYVYPTAKELFVTGYKDLTKKKIDPISAEVAIESYGKI